MGDEELLSQREEDERLLDFFVRVIRERGGARRLVLGADLYREVQDSLTNEDFGKVSAGGRHPFQNISHIFGVPVEVDYEERERVEFLD